MINNIGILRSSMALTQRELSQLTGLSIAAIQKLEAQKSQPSLATLQVMEPIFGFKLAWVPQPPDR